MTKVGILISGGGSNMVRLVESMVGDHPGRPAIVVSNVPDAAGLKKAEDLGVRTGVIDHTGYYERHDFEEALLQKLKFAGVEVLCLAGFMRVLTASFVAEWQGRILNIHPSLLPKYRGLNTHKRALEAGDKEHGCTVHLVTPDLDGGPILGQRRVSIDDGDTADDLAAKVLIEEHQLYPEILRKFLEERKTSRPFF
ncbi:MAG: phosphoribosylglycinamide formyltransferase [Planktomarina sp.]